MCVRLGVVLAVGLIGAGAARASESRPPPKKVQEQGRFLLKLHVPSQAGIYFSAWGDGDAVTDHDGSDGKRVTYRRRLVWTDGCTWEASEELTPVAADKYTYRYREAPLSCPPGATADVGATTPRDGEVTVHPIPDQRPLTPLVAWAKGWENRK
ncbi:MAG: hypothetical protein KF773_13645 [Deltaproteobacteria bacterium]|nr:hypothetical protein [Deltaproteobacteria bacterium]MCW5806422.1 hypothetical protein [Deltaproteobacteria bacterium]